MKLCNKYPCSDCKFCQFCSETRCITCRNQNKINPKMSAQEQIKLYQQINSECSFPEKPIYYKKPDKE